MTRTQWQCPVVLHIATNVAVSVIMVLVNKYTLVVFPFPITLTAAHQLFCFLFTRVLFSFFPSPSVSPSVPDAMVAGSTNVIGLILMNASILLNPVSLHQSVKLLSVPTITLIQFWLFNAPPPSFMASVALFIMLCGIGLSTTTITTTTTSSVPIHIIQSLLNIRPSISFLHNVYLSLFSHYSIGLSVALFAVLTTAFAHTAMQYLPTFKHVSGLHLVSAISPWSTLTAIILAVCFEDIPPPSIIMYFGLPVITSCTLAVLANIVGNALIKSTSAITYNVVGHLKTVLIMSCSLILFPTLDPITTTKSIGIVVALVGMVMYSLAPSGRWPPTNPPLNKHGLIESNK